MTISPTDLIQRTPPRIFPVGLDHHRTQTPVQHHHFDGPCAGGHWIWPNRGVAVIRGGENIYPREIEQLLFEHPAVADAAVRDDVTPLDLLRAQIGFSYEITHPDWQASARRLTDIFMDGLRCKRLENSA